VDRDFQPSYTSISLDIFRDLGSDDRDVPSFFQGSTNDLEIDPPLAIATAHNVGDQSELPWNWHEF
jgi:hypothetical protein